MLLPPISLLVFFSINIYAKEIDVSGIKGDSIKDAYNEMNIQLVRDAPSCDIDSTMNVVKDILAKDSSGKAASSIYKFFTGQLKVFQAYRLFGALSQLTEGHRCDASAINILQQNDLASGGRAHSILEKGECRKRVETVLLHYATLSSKECPKVYADLMRQKLDNFDPQQLNYVDHITAGPLSRHLLEFKRKDVEKNEALVKLATNTDRIMFTDLVQGSHFYYRLDSLLSKFAPDQVKFLKPINDESSGLTKLNEAKLEELVEEYGMKPCRTYVKTFGPDVFEPEIYLSTFKHEPLQNDELFYLNWIRYNICDVYIEFASRILSDVKYTAKI